MTRIQDGSPGDIEELTFFFIEQGQKLLLLLLLFQVWNPHMSSYIAALYFSVA